MKPTEDDMTRARKAARRFFDSTPDLSVASCGDRVWHQRAADVIAVAIADERERVIELMRPEYSDLIPWLRARVGGEK